jgi:hypothetical protein
MCMFTLKNKLFSRCENFIDRFKNIFASGVLMRENHLLQQ